MADAEVPVKVVEIREIFQSEARELSRYSPEFQKTSALIVLDKADLAKLGAKEGDAVRVSSPAGSVVLTVVLSTDKPHTGVAFMPCSPWLNQIASEDIMSCKTSEYKPIDAKVKKTNDAITTISDILKGFQSVKAGS